jgi:hypothetical protein
LSVHCNPPSKTKESPDCLIRFWSACFADPVATPPKPSSGKGERRRNTIYQWGFILTIAEVRSLERAMLSP